jgi:RimJ/RimL family protein N-acetyltransferase
MADAASDIVAETVRLVLRCERPGDLKVWLEHMNTPDVQARIGGPQAPDKVAENFARMANCPADQPSFYFIGLKPDGRLIGKCGLSPIETEVAPDELHGAIQVGWSLRADCWGKGYAREAAECALAMGFEQFALPRIYAQTSESNTPSWGLMRRLGMARRADLDYVDPDYPPEDNPTMVWSLDRDAWQAARAEERAHA